MTADKTLDCLELMCPMPIIKTAKALKDLRVGQVLEIQATDPGVQNDLPAWCRTTGQEFLGVEREGEVFKVYVRKLKET
jgi:tRNA 2-thiouridine synthesizing protein A